MLVYSALQCSLVHRNVELLHAAHESAGVYGQTPEGVINSGVRIVTQSQQYACQLSDELL